LYAETLHNIFKQMGIKWKKCEKSIYGMTLHTGQAF